jgi:hypothetical protein
LFASCLAGCAFSDGQPFGIAELSLFASAPSEVTTDLGYELELRRLAIEVEGMHLELATEGEEETEHGHSHGEEEEAESVIEVVRAGIEELVELGAMPVAIELDECPDDCVLSRGELAAVRVELHTLAFEVIADGVPYSAELTVETEIAAELEGSVDVGEPVGVRATALLAMPESLFDGIEWTELSTAADALDAICTHLEEGEALQVELSRFDP